MTVTVIEDGQRRVVYDDHNLIVEGALTVVSELLVQASGGTDPAANKIFKLRLGDSSVAPASEQDDVLGTHIVTKDFTTAIPNVGGVPGLSEFKVTLGAGEGNGHTIREVALLTSSGVMFARQVIGSIEKTSAMAIEFTWRVSVAAEA